MWCATFPYPILFLWKQGGSSSSLMRLLTSVCSGPSQNCSAPEAVAVCVRVHMFTRMGTHAFVRIQAHTEAQRPEITSDVVLRKAVHFAGSVVWSPPDRLGYCVPQDETTGWPHRHNHYFTQLHIVSFLLCVLPSVTPSLTRSRGPPASASPALGFQVWATMPNFFIFSWVSGIELRSRYCQGKRFADRARSPVPAAIIPVITVMRFIRKVMASMVPCSCWTFAASLSSLSPLQATPRTFPLPAGSPRPF